MAINETWLCRNHGKPRTKVTEMADRDGMSVRVSALGKVVFQLRYYYGSPPARQRLDIGVYPRMKLVEARKRAERLRAALDKGHDPRVVAAT